MIQVNDTFRGDGIPDSPPRFEPGQLVRHRRYGYRGVVVDVDGRCKADPQWYMSNRTQPDRAQPWYHVLVHGTTTCTYAAEENLSEDTAIAPVEHPLIGVFFEGFDDGHYVRNAKPWPKAR